MSAHMRFKHQFCIRVIEPYGVLLLSERGRILLRGRGYMSVAPLLDGKHTVEEIVTLLQGQLPEAEVLYAIELLQQKGYIVESSGPEATEHSTFWEILGSPPATVAKRLSETAVSVRAFGAIHERYVTGLGRALESIGVRVTNEGDFTVALADDYLQEGLSELNQEVVARGRPWLLVRPVGFEIWLGPLFVPGKTGCWACLAHRLERHRQAEAYLMERGEKGPIVLARAALPPTVETALHLAATEVAKWLVTGANEALLGRIVTFDMGSLERATHTLTRRPQCPTCGDPELVAAQQRKPVALESCRASFTEEGGYRRLRPEETFARYGHHVSPITGIVSGLRRVLHKSTSDLTISYAADHNFAHLDEASFFLHRGVRSHSGGKGKTDAQAMASALGESIERYSGVFQGDEARIRARLTDLGSAGIHPNACMLFSERQMAERERWNRRRGHFTHVPAPFDPAAEIEWSPIFPLLGGEPRYLPAANCYYGYHHAHPSPYARADSNGCAAGLTREEAVYQGLLELVERDATAIWWYNRLRRPAVDLDSFGDPYYKELAAYYRTIHRGLWVLDLTHDLRIPTFAALSHRTDKKAQDIILGFGAHLDPRIALLRAVTELNQTLPAVLKINARSEGYHWPNDEALEFWKEATLEEDRYLAPDDSLPCRTFADYSNGATGDIHEDILFCTRALASKGIDTLLLDQTRPDAGLCVVRVIAPGIRHFWARFAPGRLYDVPVQLGWLPRTLREEELNPTPMFL